MTLGLGGCIFSPKTEKKVIVPPPPIQYPVLSTPQAVLQALKLAYEGKDSVGYMKLFDRGYQGQSYDNTTNLALPQLHWADEQLHIQALATSHDVNSVTLGLQGQSGWTRTSYLGDPPGWAAIVIFQPTLQIDLVSGTSLQIPTSEYFEYKFIPTTPAPTSTTDTLWKVISWREIAPSP